MGLLHSQFPRKYVGKAMSGITVDYRTSDKRPAKHTQEHGGSQPNGRVLEGRVVGLCRMLQGVESVQLAPTGSAADCLLKIDLVIYPLNEPTKCWGIQIKSTQEQADVHAALGSVTYDGETWKVPAVIVGTWSNYKILQELSRITRLPVEPCVEEARQLITKLRKAGMREVSYAAIKDPQVRGCIGQFGFAKDGPSKFIL